MTTKKKSSVEKPENAAAPDQFVVLTRISYKSMIPNEQRYIDPYINEQGQVDPFHPNAPRVTFEYLSESDINLLLLRRVVARDKQGD